jgi:hypothetical protein
MLSLNNTLKKKVGVFFFGVPLMSISQQVAGAY